MLVALLPIAELILNPRLYRKAVGDAFYIGHYYYLLARTPPPLKWRKRPTTILLPTSFRIVCYVGLRKDFHSASTHIAIHAPHHSIYPPFGRLTLTLTLKYSPLCSVKMLEPNMPRSLGARGLFRLARNEEAPSPPLPPSPRPVPPPNPRPEAAADDDEEPTLSFPCCCPILYGICGHSSGHSQNCTVHTINRDWRKKGDLTNEINHNHTSFSSFLHHSLFHDHFTTGMRVFHYRF